MTHLLCSSSLSYGPDPRHAMDLLVPQHAENQRLLILLHAGWWQRGSRRDLLATAMHLAEQGEAVATIDYRLLQGSRSGQDLIADVVAALPVAMEECLLHGLSCDEVVLVGSGAGGLLGLCALPALAAAGHPVHGVAMVGTAPGLVPWDGCPEDVAQALGRFAGNGAVSDPAQGDLASLPPMLLLHGDNDDEVPSSLARSLHGQLVEHDVSSTLALIAGAGHRFLEDPQAQTGRSACTRLVDWLGKLKSFAGAQGDGPVVGEPAWLDS